MHDFDPEYELQFSLDLYKDEIRPEDSETPYLVSVPRHVVEDAIERLRRYAVLVENLSRVGNFLWMENLRKYGERKIHDDETPWGSDRDPTYKNMSIFVNKMPKNMTLDDIYVELALSIHRIQSGDPTGLSQYLDKEEELFEQLDTGEVDG